MCSFVELLVCELCIRVHRCKTILFCELCYALGLMSYFIYDLYIYNLPILTYIIYLLYCIFYAFIHLCCVSEVVSPHALGA
jgi:hypothetical protein